MAAMKTITTTTIEDRTNILILKSQAYPSFLCLDEHNFDIIKSNRPISNLLSPIILMKVMKTGSRAEQVFLPSSDINYMYEIGPITVTENPFTDDDDDDDESSKSNFGQLYEEPRFQCELTEHPGFYRLVDKYGGYIYPLIIQSIVAPIIETADKLSSFNKPFATLKKMQDEEEEEKKRLPKSKMYNDKFDCYGNEALKQRIRIPDRDEDKVIALRFSEWPEAIWSTFINRIPSSLKEEKESLKEEPLYLVIKSHPDSKDSCVEWRISFSFPEIKVISAMPYIYRKIYIIAKQLLKAHFSIGNNHYTSYVAKTLLMWKYDEWVSKSKFPTEDNLEDFIRDFFHGILHSYQERFLPSYFFPEINILDSFDTRHKEENFNEAVQILQKMASSKVIMSIPFNGILSSEATRHDNNDPKEFYFNMFFDDRLTPCSRQSINTLLNKSINDDDEGCYMDMLCEIYHLFLYHLYVIMHFPTTVLTEFDDMLIMKENTNRHLNETAMREIRARIHGFTISVLYILKIFGSDYMGSDNVEEQIKTYYHSLSKYLDENIPSDPRVTVMDYHLHKLWFCDLYSDKSGFEVPQSINEYFQEAEATSKNSSECTSMNPQESTSEKVSENASGTTSNKEEEYEEAVFLNWISGKLDQDIYDNVCSTKKDKISLTFHKTNFQHLIDEVVAIKEESREHVRSVHESDFYKGIDRLDLIDKAAIKEESREHARSVHESDFYKMDGIFESLVHALNSEELIERRMRRLLKDERCFDFQKRNSKDENLKEAEEELTTRKIRLWRRSSCFSYNQLMVQQCEMYNYGFTPKKFSLPSPGVYMLYLSQYRTNLDYVKKGFKANPHRDFKVTRVFHWGYHVPDDNEKNNLQFVTNITRKHNSFIRGYELIGETKKSIIPYRLSPHVFDVDGSQNSYNTIA